MFSFSWFYDKMHVDFQRFTWKLRCFKSLTDVVSDWHTAMEVYISLYLLINQYSSVNLAIRRAHFDFIKRLVIQGGGKTQQDAVNSEENITNDGTNLLAMPCIYCETLIWTAYNYHNVKWCYRLFVAFALL